MSDIGSAHVSNPLGINALADSIDAITQIGGFLIFGSAIAALAGLVVRYRRSNAEVRQQIRWLAFVGIAFFVEFGIGSDLRGRAASATTSSGQRHVSSLFLTLVLGIPIACGIAVLKYHLFDLNLVIHQRCVYALLAGFVTLVYAGVVAGLSSLVGGRLDRPVRRRDGGRCRLFQPVRRRATRLRPARLRQARGAVRDLGAVQRTRWRDLRRRRRPPADDARDRRWYRCRTRRAVARRGRRPARRRPRGRRPLIRSKSRARSTVRSSIWDVPSARSDPQACRRSRSRLPRTNSCAISRHRPASWSATSDSRASCSPGSNACRSGPRSCRPPRSDRRGARRRAPAPRTQHPRRRSAAPGRARRQAACSPKALSASDPAKASQMLRDLRDQTGARAADPARPRERDLPHHPRGARHRRAALEEQANAAGARVTVESDGVEQSVDRDRAAVYFVCLEASERQTHAHRTSRSTSHAGTVTSPSR